MRLAVAVLATLALAARGGGCDPSPWDPCADAACGAPCRVCPPDDRGCFETAVVKACDPSGECVAATPELCGPVDVTGPCEGKRCGDACTIDPPCRSATPPCMMPSIAGTCGADGVCAVGAPVCPPPPLDVYLAPPPKEYDLTGSHRIPMPATYCIAGMDCPP